jgi:drug/metabolite transporter (DMT)-like permease
MLIASAGMFGIFLFLTYYLQQTLGFSPVVTGVAFLPMVACLMATSVTSNIVLMPRTGPRPLAPTGMLLAAGGLAWLTRIGVHSSYTTAVLPALLIIGAGLVGRDALDSARSRRVRRCCSAVASISRCRSLQICLTMSGCVYMSLSCLLGPGRDARTVC